ncbi:unnamed protein product, partial [Phaeothamnion confervicola]
MNAWLFNILVLFLCLHTATAFMAAGLVAAMRRAGASCGPGNRQRVLSMTTASDTPLTKTTTFQATPEGTVDWERLWYPIIFTRFADKTLPFKFVLRGRPLVLWWDPIQSKFHAAEDCCPHRLAPLSEGRVNVAGEIECPYHGWCFEGGSGRCTLIPQLDSGPTG